LAGFEFFSLLDILLEWNLTIKNRELHATTLEFRQVPRDLHEEVRDLARRLMATKGLPQITR
jgi:hypothetical protein